MTNLLKAIQSLIIYGTATALVLCGMLLCGFSPICELLTPQQITFLVASGILMIAGGSMIAVYFASRT